MRQRLERLVHTALAGKRPERDDLLAVLQASDGDTLAIVDAAWRVRSEHYGNRVKVNVLCNAKSGLCPEDCSYCSQSKVSDAPIEKYRMLKPEEMIGQARQARDNGANRVCLVISTRGANWGEIEKVCEATRDIKDEMDIEVCACMGIIDLDKAKALAASGVDAYNHNLNTSPERYDSICTTHTYQDRLDTVKNAVLAGMSPCSGVILGMGESENEIVDMAFALADAGSGSIPVNFLIPVEGTPLGDGETIAGLTPWSCLRRLAVFRFANPAVELRASAGREVHLRSLQPLALMIANSLFLGDYLTSSGQTAETDWQMIRDLGFEPEQGSSKLPAEATVPAETAACVGP